MERFIVTFEHYVDGKCIFYKMNGHNPVYMRQFKNGDCSALNKKDVITAIEIALMCGGNDIHIKCVGEDND